MQEKQQAMQDSLSLGTPVMTTSGLHGTIAGLGDRTVDIEIAPGVVVTFARPAILEVRTPAADPADNTDDDSADGTTGGRPAADGTL
jgi:preprotein translocase subunit YajC